MNPQNIWARPASVLFVLHYAAGALCYQDNATSANTVDPEERTSTPILTYQPMSRAAKEEARWARYEEAFYKWNLEFRQAVEDLTGANGDWHQFVHTWTQDVVKAMLAPMYSWVDWTGGIAESVSSYYAGFGSGVTAERVYGTNYDSLSVVEQREVHIWRAAMFDGSAKDTVYERMNAVVDSFSSWTDAVIQSIGIGAPQDQPAQSPQLLP